MLVSFALVSKISSNGFIRGQRCATMFYLAISMALFCLRPHDTTMVIYLDGGFLAEGVL